MEYDEMIKEAKFEVRKALWEERPLEACFVGISAAMLDVLTWELFKALFSSAMNQLCLRHGYYPYIRKGDNYGIR